MTVQENVNLEEPPESLRKVDLLTSEYFIFNLKVSPDDEDTFTVQLCFLADGIH